MGLGFIFLIILGIILYILCIKQLIKYKWSFFDAGPFCFLGFLFGSIALLIFIVTILNQFKI